MPYVFPGITPFVERAASEHKLSDEMRSRIAQSWHVKAVSNALSQLPEQAAKAPEAVAEVRDRLKAVRAGLAASLEAIDAAISEVFNAVDPPRTVKSEPRPKPRAKD